MSEQAKRVLYHGPTADQLDHLVRSLAALPGCVLSDGVEPTLRWDGLEVTFAFQPDAGALLQELRRSYVNLLVLDMRCELEGLCAQARRSFHVLEVLDEAEDVEDRYAFHRILGLIAGSSAQRVDDALVELGGRGVRRVLRQDDFRAGELPGAAFAERFLREAWRMMRDRPVGKRALCASGGGITGIFFEQGALKCLDDVLGGEGVNGFDLYFGISAGAVVCGPLAVGYSIDEYMASIAGAPGGRIAPLDLRLFRLGHLDAPGFARRARLAAKTAWGGVQGALHCERDQVDLVFDYADLVAPPFRADRFERAMRGILEAPGASNDFRRLPRPLFIGATDQDLRSHVLFGDEQNDDVPISQAVQASLSINPAFSATEIRGRFYEDGAVTRTSNFIEAIRRGATLIFVLDPFVPYVARDPGFNDRRGVLYNVDQDVRTISYTRYETTRNWVLRRHPEVSSYTFVPANRLRRLISNNPMDHRPFLEIWRGAYLSTWKRLHQLQHRLGGDLRVHGAGFDLGRADAVAARLSAALTPSFADFFPDGRVAIKRPRLVCAPRP